VYLERFKMYASGFETSPYGVEWLRFEPDSPLPALVKTVPHVAFVVDDVRAAIAGQHVLIEPNSPSDGVIVAFVVHEGAPIEFIEFAGPEYEVWPGGAAGSATLTTERGGFDLESRRHTVPPDALAEICEGRPGRSPGDVRRQAPAGGLSI
jgi:hypothetical protein